MASVQQNATYELERRVEMLEDRLRRELQEVRQSTNALAMKTNYETAKMRDMPVRASEVNSF